MAVRESGADEGRPAHANGHVALGGLAKAARVLGLLLVILIVVGTFTLLFAERWLFSTWDALSVDEILFHLGMPLTGADDYTVIEFVQSYLPYLLICVAALLFVLVVGKLRHHLPQAVLFVLAVCVAFGVWTYQDLSEQVGLDAYLAGEGGEVSEFLERRYHDPLATEITFPEEKRNLIYIFLESVEISCASEEAGGAFERSAIPELEAVAADADCFAGNTGMLNGAFSLPGATWTMGAMFAQTSGIPLKLSVGGNDASTFEEFFPELVTLGDILEDEGYAQTLLIGSDASFGGRDLYFSEHGGYDLHDYGYAQEEGLIPEGYRVFWGYEDKRLFDIARSEIADAARSGRPFNYTILTVDTHFENGYVCELCGNEFGDNQYANVHACASRQVADFIGWIQRQDFYEDTCVVICGDHVTMDRDFYDDIDPDYPRRVYTAILNSAVEPQNPDMPREYSTFDLFPTTLAAMGARIDGERLGIGTNLYSTARTVVEDIGLEECERELSRRSLFLERFGQAVGISEETMARAAEQSRVYFRTENSGVVSVVLTTGGALNPAFIDEAHIDLRDVRTGVQYCLALEPEPVPNDPNVFLLTAQTSFVPEDAEHLSYEAHVSSGEFKSVVVAQHEVEISEDAE